MSIVYRIDKEQGSTFVLWHGVVTAEVFLAHARQLRSDADWPPDRHLHLSDLRTASLDVSIDEGTLAAVADLYGGHPKIATLRAAIVAGEAFKKAVVFEHLISRYRLSVIVFNTLVGACTWLGINVDHAEQTLRQLRVQARGVTNS
jgi:hypothetical protein